MPVTTIALELGETDTNGVRDSEYVRVAVEVTPVF